MTRQAAGDISFHLSAAFRALARSRTQSALALAALGGLAASSPLLAPGCALAGGLFLAARPRAGRPDGASDRPPAFGRVIDAEGSDVVLDAERVRRGILVTGGDPAGRAASLLRLAEGALANASGFMIVDDGGVPGLRSVVWDLAHRYGREDDVLHLDLTRHGRAGSNVIAPFWNARHDAIVQTISDLMDEGGADGALWRGRAVSMLSGAVRALCWLRDNEGRRFGLAALHDQLNLRRYIALADPAAHPGMPHDIRQGPASYLSSLPGFNPERGHRQSQTTMDQHGYLEMQFTKILRDLEMAFGGMDPDGPGDIDIADVVRNRRILYVRQEGTAYGSRPAMFLTSALKHALAERLAAPGAASGDAAPPFLVLQAEAETYLAKGLSQLVARTPSANLALAYACHDLSTLRSLSEREAASVIANTSTKIFLRTEDFAAAPAPRPIDGSREAASIVPGMNTKIFMRTEDMELGFPEASDPDGVAGTIPAARTAPTAQVPTNRFLALAAA